MLSGCAQEEDSQYIVTDDGETFGDFATEDSQTLIGGIVQEWRAFSIIFLMVSIGLIALAYPASTALSMPELKAWADVEMGEAVSTVLVVACVMGVLVFAEVTTHALVMGDTLHCDAGAR